nr:MAG TPA: hypothetical protein [Caudoviricetes sp.]
MRLPIRIQRRSAREFENPYYRMWERQMATIGSPRSRYLQTHQDSL